MTFEGIVNYSDFLTVPIALILISVICPPTEIRDFAGMGCGLLVWTLAEYWMHRAFHSHRFPGVRQLHMRHHQHPKDASGGTLYSTTIIAALVDAALLYVPAADVILGFLGGYLGFIVLHYVLHHVSDPHGPIFRVLARNHEIHHHEGTGKRYGVLTSFWDRVFRTA